MGQGRTLSCVWWKESLSFRDNGFETTLQSLKRFAHNWHLLCRYCKDIKAMRASMVTSNKDALFASLVLCGGFHRLPTLTKRTSNTETSWFSLFFVCLSFWINIRLTCEKRHFDNHITPPWWSHGYQCGCSFVIDKENIMKKNLSPRPELDFISRRFYEDLFQLQQLQRKITFSQQEQLVDY